MINKKIVILTLTNILLFSQNSIAKQEIGSNYCERFGLFNQYRKCDKIEDAIFDKSEKYLFVLNNQEYFLSDGSYLSY